jgi:hypothetical protein
MMSTYLFDGMDEWYANHKDDLLKGKGFVGGSKKRHYIPEMITKKSEAWVKKLHYGAEFDRAREIISTHHIGGHTQKIDDKGNISCDCKGWIFKRKEKRECRHCRELYGKLKGVSTPPKSQPDEHVVELFDIEALIKRGLK